MHQTSLKLFWHAESHQSKRQISLIWLRRDSLKRSLFRSVMVPMMLIWSYRHTLVLVSKVKRDNRQLEVQIMLSASSSFWSLWCLFMEEKLIEETLCSFCIPSTRTSSISRLSSSLDSGHSSQANLSTNHLFTSFTTSPWPLFQSCIMLSLTLSMKRTSTHLKDVAKIETNSSLWGTHIFTESELNASVSVLESSLTGIYMDFGTL